MKIVINGKSELVEDNIGLQSLKNFKGINYDLTILNGFQTDEDIVLKANDNITLIKKGQFPSYEILENMMMARNTPNIHNKLKEAHVGIAGLGGLGSNIAVMLARMGVGHLTLIDFDVVEPSNLNRQSYYIRHLGMFKTSALAEQIKEINPFVKLTLHTKRIESENVSELLKDCDIVCEAFDKAESKAMLVNVLMSSNNEVKIIASSGMAGYESANTIITRKISENLYICGDLKTEACIGNGLMAPRVAICAAHQANMVIRLIIGVKEA